MFTFDAHGNRLDMRFHVVDFGSNTHIHVAVVERETNKIAWEGSNHNSDATARAVCKNLNNLHHYSGVRFTIQE